MELAEGGAEGVRVLTSYRCLPSNLLREKAKALLRRRFRLGFREQRIVAHEVLFYPYMALRYTNPDMSRRSVAYDVLVDRLSGHCFLLKRLPQLHEREVSSEVLIDWVVGEEAGERAARRWLEQYVLRKKAFRVREIKVELVDRVAFYYPYGVAYVERGGKLGVFACDGETGKRADRRLEYTLEQGIARKEWLREQRE